MSIVLLASMVRSAIPRRVMTRDIIATHGLWVTSSPANFASAHAVDCRELRFTELE
jgi:hypothetical protein